VYWDQYPHTFARVQSKGEWEPYKYLVDISTKVANGIRKGGYRGIFNMPPQHGKSELLSKWTPAWLFHHNPAVKIILASYEANFARKWGRRVRRAVDPSILSRDSQAAQSWETTAGGTMITAGVDGPVTGEGGDVLIFDDPYKNWKQASSKVYQETLWEWWRSTFMTRKRPNASVILIHTRWNAADLTAVLTAGDSRDKWDVTEFPAIAEPGCSIGRQPGEALCPDRYPLSHLVNERDSADGIGPFLFRAMYQQRPDKEGGNIWPREKFKLWNRKTKPWSHDGVWFQSWDLKCKGDLAGSSYVCGQTWCADGANRYLIDERRGRWDIVESMSHIVGMSKGYPQATLKLVEDKANGPAVMRLLNDEIGGMVPIEPYGSKLARAVAASPQIYAGNVFVPDPSMPGYSWVHSYLDEVGLFPNGRYDDRVDTTSQALQYTGTGTGSAIYC
jgi:predicted phage terminase large subunit-like protein